MAAAQVCRCDEALEAVKRAIRVIDIYDALGRMLPDRIADDMRSSSASYNSALGDEDIDCGAAVGEINCQPEIVQGVRVDTPSGPRFGALRLSGAGHELRGEHGVRWLWDAEIRRYRGTDERGAVLSQMIALLGFNAKANCADVVLHADSEKPRHALALLYDTVFCGHALRRHAPQGLLADANGWIDLARSDLLGALLPSLHLTAPLLGLAASRHECRASLVISVDREDGKQAPMFLLVRGRCMHDGESVALAMPVDHGGFSPCIWDESRKAYRDENLRTTVRVHKVVAVASAPQPEAFGARN